MPMIVKAVSSWTTHWHFFGKFYISFRWRPTYSTGKRMPWGFDFGMGPSLLSYQKWPPDEQQT